MRQLERPQAVSPVTGVDSASEVDHGQHLIDRKRARASTPMTAFSALSTSSADANVRCEAVAKLTLAAAMRRKAVIC